MILSPRHREWYDHDMQKGSVVRFIHNGILGVKTPSCEGIYDCSARGPGQRHWAGETAVITDVIKEKVTSIRQRITYLEVITPDGRSGFIQPGDIKGVL